MNRTAKPWEPCIQRAVDFHLDGDLNAACKVLRLAIKRYPGVAALHSYLAGYLYLAEDAVSALPHGRSAVALAPDKPVPSRQLILILFELGQAEPGILEARRYLERTQHLEEITEWEGLIVDAERSLQGGDPDA